jgi:hypothetical protein
MLAAPFELRVGEELEDVQVAKSHGAIAGLTRVSDAEVRRGPLAAEALDALLRTNRDEPDGYPRAAVFPVELAQLRERLTEERSTDVT